MKTIWLATFRGRGDYYAPDVLEAYASEGGALRAIALAIKTWISDAGYVRDSKTQTKLDTLFQREQYHLILRCWNTYAKTKHEPRGTYGIELQEVPFDPSVHIIKELVAVTCPSRRRYEGDIVGCGSVNISGPDGEGLYDCGDCGLFFNLNDEDEEESRGQFVPSQEQRDCRVEPCDLCVKRANGEPCEPGCLGFRISTNRGELIPCAVCGLSDEEVHDRVQEIYTKHCPAKKDHPSSDGCGPYCRGWDVFDANREHFEIERSDSCGVFKWDEDAFTAACKFIHEVTGTPYNMLLEEKDHAVWCAKCGAPLCAPQAGVDRCIECADDRVMPWKMNHDDEGNPCDCCGAPTEDIVPSVDYDNSLAEELQCILCEPCWEKLRDLPFEEAERIVKERTANVSQS